MDKRSIEDKGVKGEALVGLSKPYKACGWRKQNKSIRCAIRFDPHVYNHKGPASEWKNSIQKGELIV